MQELSEPPPAYARPVTLHFQMCQRTAAKSSASGVESVRYRRTAEKKSVTTPPAEAGGFSGQLRGHPPAYVPNAVSRRKSECPEMHNLRRRHVPVENRTAIAAMLPLGPSLGLDRPALRTGLRGSARIDQNNLPPSVCSFVGEHRGQLRPRGVVDRLGQHRAGKSR